MEVSCSTIDWNCTLYCHYYSNIYVDGLWVFKYALGFGERPPAVRRPILWESLPLSGLQATRLTVAKLFLWFVIFLTQLSACLFPPQALNKKEHRGCDSPDADGSYTLTPTTEEKYKRINEEFDNMMKTHKIVSCSVVLFTIICYTGCFSFSVPYILNLNDDDQSWLSVTSPVNRPSSAVFHACCTRKYAIWIHCNVPGFTWSHCSFSWQWDPFFASYTPPQKPELSTKIPQHRTHRCVGVCACVFSAQSHFLDLPYSFVEEICLEFLALVRWLLLWWL